jgi:hypothetical protein
VPSKLAIFDEIQLRDLEFCIDLIRIIIIGQLNSYYLFKSDAIKKPSLLIRGGFFMF